MVTPDAADSDFGISKYNLLNARSEKALRPGVGARLSRDGLTDPGVTALNEARADQTTDTRIFSRVSDRLRL